MYICIVYGRYVHLSEWQTTIQLVSNSDCHNVMSYNLQHTELCETKNASLYRKKR
jgi:hypothetical protein